MRETDILKIFFSEIKVWNILCNGFLKKPIKFDIATR